MRSSWCNTHRKINERFRLAVRRLHKLPAAGNRQPKHLPQCRRSRPTYLHHGPAGRSRTGLNQHIHRPKDDAGFAVGTTLANSRVAGGDAAEGLRRPKSEYAFELYYTYCPTGGLLFRPNVRYVVDPGGIAENKNVVVQGLKTAATF